MKKYKAVGEVPLVGSAAELGGAGVMTRARSLAVAAAAAAAAAKRPRSKRIKKQVMRRSGLMVELRRSSRRRRLLMAPANSSSLSASPEYYYSANSEQLTAFSCSSSNSSVDVMNDGLVVVDAQQQTNSALETSAYYLECTERFREERMRSSAQSEANSDDLETAATAPPQMPSESEIQEFFVAAEMNLQKRFTNKYNFDIVKDVPLEGRYEWVPIKP